ncbi:hypothetical protein [Flavobacterium sp.]|uniref:hypothetical protein n=1 Tax=Flavobacterium sp. TaxID=239 RepID=UPI003752C94D
MIKTEFITTEYRNNQLITLTGITALAVYNSGNCISNINGKPVYPGQKEIVVVADGTYSEVNLQVEFIELEVKKAGPIGTGNESQPIKQLRGVSGSGGSGSDPNIDPNVKPSYFYIKTIILIYKKIS